MLPAVAAWQPFASFVVHGALRVLTFRAPIAHAGPIAIYAAETPPTVLAALDDPTAWARGARARVIRAAVVDVAGADGRASDLPRMAIVGVAFLGPCVKSSPLVREFMRASLGTRDLAIANCADGRYLCPVTAARPCVPLELERPYGGPTVWSLPHDVGRRIAETVTGPRLPADLRRLLDHATAQPPASLDTPPEPPARA